MNYRRLLLLFITAVLFSSLAPDARASECIEYDVPSCALYWRAKIVFIARVTNIIPPPREDEDSDARATVHLLVEKVYRGEIGETALDVQTNGADGKVEYEKGKRYLIYAYRYDLSNHAISTSVCVGSHEISDEDDDEDLAYIRSLARDKTESSIEGRVFKGDYDPLGGIKIEIEGQDKKYPLETDSEGRFKIVIDEPGMYKVRAIGLPNSFFYTYRHSLKESEREGLPVVELEMRVPAGGCAYVDFHLFTDAPKKKR